MKQKNIKKKMFLFKKIDLENWCFIIVGRISMHVNFIRILTDSNILYFLLLLFVIQNHKKDTFLNKGIFKNKYSYIFY